MKKLMLMALVAVALVAGYSLSATSSGEVKEDQVASAQAQVSDAAASAKTQASDAAASASTAASDAAESAGNWFSRTWDWFINLF